MTRDPRCVYENESWASGPELRTETRTSRRVGTSFGGRRVGGSGSHQFDKVPRTLLCIPYPRLPGKYRYQGDTPVFGVTPLVPVRPWVTPLSESRHFGE